ncbi:Uncharacterized protein dnm_008220 [Desulfonema magnum]|uniref:Uncharacterized protein n=1 Tax=Desulfonema magnum TaxID=45655 RepID=A0A975GKK8_9BACT|nr:Uncharacterized protein dnm_008220 [Desulfonema magnum]
MSDKITIFSILVKLKFIVSTEFSFRRYDPDEEITTGMTF